MTRFTKLAAGLACTLLVGAGASATTVPFTENFDVDVSGWEDNVNDPLTFVASGGPDGSSYASAAFNYLGFSSPFGGGPVIFRAGDSDDASGDAFVGDWLADGVGEVSVWVRHDTPEDLTFFLRVATSFNFPGAVIGSEQVVPPNTWTQVFFDIDPSSPLCIGETVTCADALASVGNFQLGTDAPASLVATDFAYTLDVDQASLTPVPEPGTALQLVTGIAGLALLGRKRVRR